MTDSRVEGADRLRASRGRVLVAEDDAVSRLVIGEMLHQLGCEVRVVEDGRAALEAARTARFDLAILDLRMPVMSGTAAARAIRGLQRAGHVAGFPIVACTASAMAHERAECLAAGMDDVLVKPFMFVQLEALLDRWMVRSDRP